MPVTLQNITNGSLDVADQEKYGGSYQGLSVLITLITLITPPAIRKDDLSLESTDQNVKTVR